MIREVSSGSWEACLFFQILSSVCFLRRHLSGENQDLRRGVGAEDRRQPRRFHRCLRACLRVIRLPPLLQRRSRSGDEKNLQPL